MARDGDDALNWEGDDDPTLDVGTSPAQAEASAVGSQPVALPDGFTAVGRGRDKVGHLDDDGTVTPPGEPQPLGNAALITVGVIAGLYVFFLVGWVIGGLRLQGAARYLVTDVMFQGSLWLAILAPVLWFGTVFLLTRRSRPWVRFVWLLAGVAVLIPWPFVMTGAVGR